MFPEPFQVTKDTIEKFIMNGNKKGDLAIRMDHATGVLSFDTDVFSSTKAIHAGSGAGSAERYVILTQAIVGVSIPLRQSTSWYINF